MSARSDSERARLAREAAEAVDTVLDQGPQPNPDDVDASRTAVLAAAREGVTGEQIRARLRDR